MKDKIVVHVTHEAVHKIGGIGTVLHGLFTSKNYQKAIARSVLIGPLFGDGSNGDARLGKDGKVLYSSLDGIRESRWSSEFQSIEKNYSVAIVYGKRRFFDRDTGVETFVETILVEASHIDSSKLDLFKWRLFERFGIDSFRYQHEWDYEQYLRIAEPAFDALSLLRSDGRSKNLSCFVLAHEFMGMPFALKSMLDGDHSMKTIFYAHETATARSIVEGHSGHDVMFYNVLRLAMSEGKSVNEVFGDQSHYFKHALIELSHLCDGIFAVGDLVVEELRFLNDELRHKPIDLVYNGIPAFELELSEKFESKRRLQQYAQNLVGYWPDYVMSHVSRLVPSKGFWRDFYLLNHLDQMLALNGRNAVLFILSTEPSWGRSPEDVLRMEAEYGWPTYHKIGYPDLVGAEIDLNNSVATFNQNSKAIKVVFVNQFGWDNYHCGIRMPLEMEFMDIRKGSDVELGQSIYEPFGIAQIEPLSFGAICVGSNVCGCSHFAKRATDWIDVPNLVMADYTYLTNSPDTVEGLLAIDGVVRTRLEQERSWEIAVKLLGSLPRNDHDFDEILKKGYNIASRMSWDVVVSDYFLPALERLF